MKYSHDYSKLKKDEYTTIRRYSKGKVGDVVLEQYPSGEHYAKIMRMKRATLGGLDLKTLQDDTDLKTREDIYRLFNSFYRKPINIENEKIYLYYMKKVIENDGKNRTLDLY